MKILSKIFFSLILVVGLTMTASVVSAQVLPTGCSTSTGYSPSTGVACNGATAIMPGCTSTAGYSISTGLACNGATALANGYNGSATVTTQLTGGYSVFLNGCSSLSGYSATTGYSCSTSFPGVALGVFTTTPPVTPGLPTTGASAHAPMNIAILLTSSLVAFFALRAGLRRSVVQ